MTETKDTTEKTMRGGARKPLSLQRTVESGHVRQNFCHGRSKSVVVEKRRTRKLGGTETEASPVRGARARAAGRHEEAGQGGHGCSAKSRLRRASWKNTVRGRARRARARARSREDPQRPGGGRARLARHRLWPLPHRLPPRKPRPLQGCRDPKRSELPEGRHRASAYKVGQRSWRQGTHRRSILRCSRAKAVNRVRSTFQSRRV